MPVMDGEMGEGDGMKTITNRRGRERGREEGREGKEEGAIEELLRWRLLRRPGGRCHFSKHDSVVWKPKGALCHILTPLEEWCKQQL